MRQGEEHDAQPKDVASATMPGEGSSLRTVNFVSGVLLVAVGLLLLSGQFFRLSIWLQKTFPASF
jgi:hypothetical protein